MRIIAAVILAGSLTVGLTACAPEAENEPVIVAEPTATPPPTAEPPTEPESPAPVVLPDCTDLIPNERIGELFEPSFSLLDYEVVGDSGFTNSIGPKAMEALEQSTQRQGCVWGIENSDQFSVMVVSELPAEARDSFVTELQKSDYVESNIDGQAVFTYAMDVDYGMPSHHWYGFVDTVWVGMVSVWGPRDAAAEQILHSVAAANPQLVN